MTEFTNDEDRIKAEFEQRVLLMQQTVKLCAISAKKVLDEYDYLPPGLLEEIGEEVQRNVEDVFDHMIKSIGLRKIDAALGHTPKLVLPRDTAAFIEE